jgi:hypothetical protein
LGDINASQRFNGINDDGMNLEQRHAAN